MLVMEQGRSSLHSQPPGSMGMDYQDPCDHVVATVDFTLRGLHDQFNEVQMPSLDVPASGLPGFVKSLARKHGVRYIRSGIDELGDVIRRLTDDEVVTDEAEDLIVELKRANAIDSSTMVTLLGNYLDERSASRNMR